MIALVLFLVIVVNLVHPCLLGANPVNGLGRLVGVALTDSTIANDLKKLDLELAKKRVLKPKDPAKTVKAKEELDAEGRSIVDEKSVSMNLDKSGGKGFLKMRFQVTSPHNATARSQFSAVSANVRASGGFGSTLKASPQSVAAASF